MISQWVDIHSHILFGVDDGAEKLAQSMEMLKIAEKEGITDIIATPHYKADRHCVSKKGIFSRIETLKTEMKKEGLHIRLYPGNEIHYFSEIVDLLDAKEICSLAGSEYVLVEFAPCDPFLYIRDGLYKLADAGYRPILAHAERYEALFQDRNTIRSLTERGIQIQVNAGSITGDFGRRTAKTARYLLKENLVNFVATDAHDLGKRAPRLSNCITYIKKKKGEDMVQRLLSYNPAQILQQD